MKEGFRRVIYGGNSLINTRNWLPSKDVNFKGNQTQATRGVEKVKDLFLNKSKSWNANLIWNTFEKKTAREILNTHMSQYDGW